MKQIILIPMVLTLLFTMSCKKEEGVTINGAIATSNNIPVSGAKITIDNIINWSSLSSSDGTFQIENIPHGKHTMVVNRGDVFNSFSEKKFEIYVDESNTDFGVLTIHKPIHLNEPTNISYTTLDLTWNKSDAPEFYEYKLYRHTSAGLDFSTAELIYVSTNPEDTTFSDEGLLRSTNYYYRVYEKSSMEQLGASNIVEISTGAGNLIPGGDFESLTTFESFWSKNVTQGTLITTIDDMLFKEGAGSLYNRNDSAFTNGNTNVYTDLILTKPVNIGINRNYEISGWFKASGQQTDHGSVWVTIKQGNDYVTHIDLGQQAGGFGGNHGINDTGWIFKSKIFQVAKNEPISVQIYMPFEHVWVDDLKLEAVD